MSLSFFQHSSSSIVRRSYVAIKGTGDEWCVYLCLSVCVCVCVVCVYGGEERERTSAPSAGSSRVCSDRRVRAEIISLSFLVKRVKHTDRTDRTEHRERDTVGRREYFQQFTFSSSHFPLTLVSLPPSALHYFFRQVEQNLCEFFIPDGSSTGAQVSRYFQSPLRYPSLT